MSPQLDDADLPITPWPFGPGRHEAVIVGGTFDPPHLGHVGLAAAARAARAPGAGLVFVPAHRSPFKLGGRGQTSADHRVAMLRLAIADVPDAAVWTDEIDRAARAPEAPSYTIDTLSRAKRVGSERLRIVLGADQMAQLHRWREPRGVLAIASPIVLLRPPLETGAALREALAGVMEQAPEPAKELAMELAPRRFWSEAEIEVCCNDAVSIDPRFAPISSSTIRATIAASGVGAVPAGWLAPSVAAYIEREGLYRG